MTEPDADGVPAQRLRSLQIVVGVLVIGVLGFAVVAAVIRARGGFPAPPDVPIVSYLAVGVTLMMLVTRAVMMTTMAKAGRTKLLSSGHATTNSLLEQYAARTIVGSALLEGSAFFLLVTYMMEGRPWTLAGGLVMAGLLAVLQFPTRTRVESALEAERQAIEDQRSMA